ncbi:unnamed protein product [Lasius platythorax]|uniref:Chitin-binding type-2 domain-containing protein n=1 Tax=Lasius platythorax TaxID=488582 RepID=A0AAV2PBI7_9HYME
MKGIYIIAIVFVASWTVIIANEDFNRDKSKFIREEDLDKIPTRCPLQDTNDTVHLAHEIDCTKFYKCAWGKRLPFDCPWIDEAKTQRLHFNKWKQFCDWPEQAGCSNCPGNEEDGYPPVKLTYTISSCNQYYECSRGEKLLRFCPSGVCFSATCQDCVRNRTSGNCD